VAAVSASAVNTGALARIYLEWGWIHGATRRYQTAREALGAAVAAAEPLRPRNLLCEALRESAVVARYEGDFGLADSLLGRSELIAQQEGYDLELGQALFLRATIAHHRGSFAHAPRLTVRAAVEPLGLPTAALAAGARWVLAGTVDIGDTTTASLMSAFYKTLDAGFTPAAALQRVQVSFLRSRPHTPPGTWAGLTIVGDGFTPLGMRR
jgi:hypothetical protein